MFGKLENGNLVLAPKEVIVENMEFTVTDEDGNERTVVENMRVINPREDVLVPLGYLPVEETDAPAVEEGYHAIPLYEKVGQAIIRKWLVEKMPKESPSVEDRLRTLENSLGRVATLLLGKEGE